MPVRFKRQIAPPISSSTYVQLIKECCVQLSDCKEYVGACIKEFRDEAEIRNEKKNFKMTIKSETGEKLFCLKVTGGFGSFTRTKYYVDNGRIWRYDWRDTMWKIIKFFAPIVKTVLTIVGAFHGIIPSIEYFLPVSPMLSIPYIPSIPSIEHTQYISRIRIRSTPPSNLGYNQNFNVQIKRENLYPKYIPPISLSNSRNTSSRPSNLGSNQTFKVPIKRENLYPKDLPPVSLPKNRNTSIRRSNLGSNQNFNVEMKRENLCVKYRQPISIPKSRNNLCTPRKYFSQN